MAARERGPFGIVLGRRPDRAARYSAKGFQLTPDHWITMPAGYSMVGLTAGPPGTNDTALNGNVVGAGCTTFPVSR